MSTRKKKGSGHGGDWVGYENEYGREALDFSMNVNPLGVPGSVAKAIEIGAQKGDRYPDPECRRLRRALAEHECVDEDWIFCGNGAGDIIDRIAIAFGGGRALVTAPTFSEYEEALVRCGCRVDHIDLDEDDGFRITRGKAEEIKQWLSANEGQIEGAGRGRRIIFLCEPNNPTGITTDIDILTDILKACEEAGAILVIDECFNGFMDDPGSHTMKGCICDHPGLIILKAFTKLYGMAGVRLGYCLCSDGETIAALKRSGQPWNVSIIAEEAGLAALEDEPYLEESLEMIRLERKWLKDELAAMGMIEVYGEANYILFRWKEGLTKRLMDEGIMIRDCSNYRGLGTGWYRIAVRTHHENVRLMEALGTCAGHERREIESRKHTPCIMIQGTMSDSGKSVLCAALCRIFREDGLKAAPFKSQNMALNSYITLDGLEMGRAQVMQAEAAGIEPDARMNPVLLKPSSDTGSQVIVLGKIRDQMTAMEYHRFKPKLIPEIMKAYEELADEKDIMVIEGAGSPAEINLADNDIVNMGMAKMADAPVLLVGDIDRGGVFAQLYGTVRLMDPEDRKRIRGLVINKFRGDPEILKPGLEMLENKTGIPVLGVIPMLDVDLDDEDSLAPRLLKKEHESPLDIVIIRLPRLSNFTDFNALDQRSFSSVRYVDRVDEIGSPDMIIIPGTKSTTADLLWLRQSGLESEILKFASSGGPVLGVCGGYQMLGRTLEDPEGNEGEIPFLKGMGLLPADTVFTPDKSRTRVKGTVIWPEDQNADAKASMDGVEIEGYEIHMGQTRVDGAPFCRLEGGQSDGAVNGNVFGTYLHGLFDTGGLAEGLIAWLCRRKGIDPGNLKVIPREEYVQQQYDKLARNVRKSLDMDRIYDIIGISKQR